MMVIQIFSLHRIIVLLFAYLSLALALDQADPEAHGTYFASPNTTIYPQVYVFALNVVPETGDIFFHMSAYAAVQSNTSAFSWMGIGFGSKMKDTFMFICYPSSNGTGLTISPRVARGHSEPEFQADVVVEKIFSDEYAPAANQVKHGIMIAHAVCRNCTQWTTLDLTNKRQPFIFALGADPGKGDALESDNPNAALRRHSFYGHFEGDMTFATSTPEHGRVPPPNDPGASASGVADTNFAYAFTSKAFDTHRDNEWGPVLHGVVMSLAFILIFPSGALLMRMLRRVGFIFHAGVQMVGLLFVLIGLGVGVYVSRQYNRSRHFGTGHQVVGLLVFAAVIVQAGLGAIQHRIFRKTKQKTIFGIVHRFLGPTVIILGLVNGGLGLDLAGNLHYTISYGVVVAIVGILFLVPLVVEKFYRRPKRYRPEQDWPGRKANEDDRRAFLTMDTPVSAYEMTWMSKSKEEGVK